MKEDSITKNERISYGAKTKVRNAKVVVDESEIKIAADAINKLADGVAGMRKHAKDKLIVLMLNDVTGVPKRTIQTIIDVIPELARIYMVKK